MFGGTARTRVAPDLRRLPVDFLAIPAPPAASDCAGTVPQDRWDLIAKISRPYGSPAVAEAVATSAPHLMSTRPVAPLPAGLRPAVALASVPTGAGRLAGICTGVRCRQQPGTHSCSSSAASSRLPTDSGTGWRPAGGTGRRGPRQAVCSAPGRGPGAAGFPGRRARFHVQARDTARCPPPLPRDRGTPAPARPQAVP